MQNKINQLINKEDKETEENQVSSIRTNLAEKKVRRNQRTYFMVKKTLWMNLES